MKDLSYPTKIYRTIWISDFHLGTKGSQAKEILNFLRHSEANKIYLVGDIVDGWQLSKRWYWPQAHNDVIQKILEKARNGTEVIFIPGNHDEVARDFVDSTLGGIQVRDDAIHVSADGKKYWVVHGDLFDNVIQHARWLAYIGDWAYVFLLKVNTLFNSIRIFFKFPYWSLSQYIKSKVKMAVSFISAFEKSMVTETRRRGCDGVICGHIHKAEIREIEGILYANDGDWVESMTALVENFDGNLEIVEWANVKPKQTSIEYLE
jgi:UDP-2,3-diacylglucosamine pyrophosphatase LpxH